MSPRPSRRDYQALLQCLYQSLAPFCAAMDDALDGYAHPVLSPADLPRFLLADLNDLDACASHALSPSPFQCPAIESEAEWLGAWYVLEGAALGGAVIAPQLRRHLGADLPVRYLAERGEPEHRRWQQFDAHFSGILEHSELLEPVISGAKLSYGLIAQAMQAAQQRRDRSSAD